MPFKKLSRAQRDLLHIGGTFVTFKPIYFLARKGGGGHFLALDFLYR
jgi:hypothetical protein